MSDLVKKTGYDAKISDIENKSFTTSDYNKFTNGIIDAKVKNKELVNKSDIFKFINNSDLDKEIETLATNAESKAKEDKIVKLETYDSSLFIGENYTFSMMGHKTF